MNKTELDQEQIDRHRAAAKWHRQRGKVQQAAEIMVAIETGEPASEELLRTDGLVPMVDPTDGKDFSHLDIPPRAGQGSKLENWVDFALEVSDIDPEIINAQKKRPLIKMLEANGVIPSDNWDK